MPITPEARNLIIRTIIGEAGGEPPEGWQAVANVIINRAFTGKWGEAGNATKVVTAPGQFETWARGNPQGRAASPNDPLYQRIGQIVDGIVSGQIPDNTNGATNYYASGGPGAAPTPSWAQGQQGQQIGNHSFYKLYPILNAPATQPVGNPPANDGSDARAYLANLTAHPTRAGDTSNFHPEFANRLAAAIKQARAEGLPVGVGSGFREPGQTGSRYDAQGNSSHSYGLASDISGLDGPNGKITTRWGQIAEANGLHNPYGVGNTAEFNHWQLPEQPLERTPAVLAQLKAARATGNQQAVWAAYQPTGVAATPAPAATPPNQGPELVGQPQQIKPGEATYVDPSVVRMTPTAADVPAQNAQPTEGPAAGLPGNPTAAPAAAPARILPMGQGDQSTQHERSDQNAYIQPGAVMPSSQGGTAMAINKGYDNSPVKQGSVVPSQFKNFGGGSLNKGFGAPSGSVNEGFGVPNQGIPAAVARTVRPPPRKGGGGGGQPNPNILPQDRPSNMQGPMPAYTPLQEDQPSNLRSATPFDNSGPVSRLPPTAARPTTVFLGGNVPLQTNPGAPPHVDDPTTPDDQISGATRLGRMFNSPWGQFLVHQFMTKPASLFTGSGGGGTPATAPTQQQVPVTPPVLGSTVPTAPAAPATPAAQQPWMSGLYGGT